MCQARSRCAATSPRGSRSPKRRSDTGVKRRTLSKIVKEFCGNANTYMEPFEANQTMREHPDQVYPGQVLRSPD